MRIEVEIVHDLIFKHVFLDWEHEFYLIIAETLIDYRTKVYECLQYNSFSFIVEHSKEIVTFQLTRTRRPAQS